MSHDVIRLVLVDPAGAELETHTLFHPREVRVGLELWLELDGRRTLVRILRQVPGEGGQRLVHAIEVSLRCPFCASRLFAIGGPANLAHDAEGDHVTCPQCRRRVAMERVPTDPPGGPARLRVAADQPIGPDPEPASPDRA
jgi:DNA-directed RNA polymerase subunit RPC12/RpoP